MTTTGKPMDMWVCPYEEGRFVAEYMGQPVSGYVDGCGGARYPASCKNAIRAHMRDKHPQLFAETHRRVIAKLQGDGDELVGHVRLGWQMNVPSPRYHAQLHGIISDTSTVPTPSTDEAPHSAADAILEAFGQVPGQLPSK